jgi:hypothetical protein
MMRSVSLPTTWNNSNGRKPKLSHGWVIIDVDLAGSVTVAELSRVDTCSNVLVFLAQDVANKASSIMAYFIASENAYQLKPTVQVSIPCRAA